jgi:pimeloyl-ACP methyl ester carboxylesterase
MVTLRIFGDGLAWVKHHGYLRSMREHDLAGRDGRNLRVREAGVADGIPVFVHHGSPAAGLFFRPWVEDAERRGIRLISHDRPGYGGSDPKPGRVVADVVEDIHDIADHLGVDRYATWGISGGGPHALACAALGGDRCVAAAALASAGPFDADGLDFYAGMGEDNVREFELVVREGREGIEELAAQNAAEMLAAAPEDVFAGLESLVSDVDKAVMSDEFARLVYDMTHVGIGASVEGWIEDDVVFVQPWGLDVGDIEVPVLVYQGRQDLMVPFQHGVWLAEHIPGAEARLYEDEGHLTLLVNRVADTHAWLLERF